jgi:hypothetical protein
VEDAPVAKAAGAASTDTAVGDATADKDKTLSEICDEAAARISGKLPAAGSASSMTQGSLEVTAEKAVAAATTEVADDAKAATGSTDVQAHGAPEASNLPGIAEDVASVKAGVAGALTLAVKPDYSFKESLEMTIEAFIAFWSLAEAPKLKYSIDKNWPENNFIRNPLNTGKALAAVVFLAIWKLGARCAEGIQYEKYLQPVAEPTAKLFASPGPAGESANRD